MYDEKRMQMERGSISGSYFTVTMPDGSTKQRLKIVNADPGVHSSLALDQIAQGQLQTVPTLPTITESKVQEMDKNETQKFAVHDKDVENLSVENNFPRNASQPVFSSQTSGSCYLFYYSVELKFHF